MSSISLQNKITELSELMSPVINELLTKDVETRNVEVMLYQCTITGKMIRPTLVVVSGQLFGASLGDLMYPAAAAEIFHNATLIIDDIIDHSEFRRDQPTCWKKYGKSVTVCVALSYLSSVFTGINRVKNGRKLVDLYGKTTKTVVDGEVKDVLFERSGRGDEDFVTKNRYRHVTTGDYFEMIDQKTASLLKMCCEAGAICAEASDEQIKKIGDFGFNLGMAFQIRDDILDIFGDEKVLGKKIGKDIIEKKMGNFVILSAIDQLSFEDKTKLCELLECEREITDDDIVLATNLIEKTNARQSAEEVAGDYTKKAYESLNKLPQNEHSDTLRELARYIVDRKK
jgi:geranylgeranyl diphosphate synthase, type I